MPRASLIRTNEFPYHVTNRSNNKEFFYIPLNLLWEIFCDKLAYLQNQMRFEIHAFVLMSNHYHLLVSTPDKNIGEGMKYLHREIARESNKVSGRINHFFGGRYKWSVISKDLYYLNTLKYIFRNPVDAGICNSIHDYAYSSLNREEIGLAWLPEQYINLKIHDPSVIDWIESKNSPEQNNSIKLALTRREFKLPQINGGYATRLDYPQSE